MPPGRLGRDPAAVSVMTWKDAGTFPSLPTYLEESRVYPMSEVDDLITQVRERGCDLWLAGPQTEAAIATLEQTLSIILPPSYRSFLARFGGAAIDDSIVSGIIDSMPLEHQCGWLYGDTLRFQEDWDLPANLLVIQPDEDAPYCLDTSKPNQNGEHPVVCYELHSKHVRQIAENFEIWLVEWFLRPRANEDA